LLQFVYAISNCLEKVETFVFGTRLTRITRQLGCGDADVALDQAIDSIQDGGGGTLARGMHTALPCADDFLPVHNLASLEQLGQLLEQLGEHRPLCPYHRPKPNA
jgi:uncharacterized protein with von Willebrand factor type A (vWA) domain